jgi:hypothetical protein
VADFTEVVMKVARKVFTKIVDSFRTPEFLDLALAQPEPTRETMLDLFRAFQPRPVLALAQGPP